MIDILTVTKTWQRDGRWSEVEPHRDALMREARRSGLDKADARQEVYAKLLEMFPQSSVEERQPNGQAEAGGGANPTGHADATETATHSHTREDSAAVLGLGAIPPDWPALVSNATLGAEIGWCQANRLRVVEEKSHGVTVVHLDRARTPAPSWSAIGWLETSIRAYAKFVDVAAKVTATQQDEQEMVRRERMAIDEIRSLLAEMQAE